jgi:hypothetical protein
VAEPLNPFARRARLVPPRDQAHDGDSFWMEYDAGCTGRMEPELRLLDAYMPELDEPGGPELRAVVNTWFAESDHTLTWPFWIHMEMTKVREPGQKRTFTRYLATVWRFDGRATIGPSVNDVVNLVLAGHPEWGHGKGRP